MGTTIAFIAAIALLLMGVGITAIGIGTIMTVIDSRKDKKKGE